MDAATPTPVAAPLTHAQARVIVIGMMLPIFMGSIDQTILASALPSIGRDFRQLQRPAVADHHLPDRRDRNDAALRQGQRHPRPPFRADHRVLAYMAGSLVCALAPNMAMLIFGRVLHGIGGGGLDLDRHGRARRRRFAQGPRKILRVFLRDLYDRRRLRTAARRASWPTTCTGRRSSGSTFRSDSPRSSSPST